MRPFVRSVCRRCLGGSSSLGMPRHPAQQHLGGHDDSFGGEGREGDRGVVGVLIFSLGVSPPRRMAGSVETRCIASLQTSLPQRLAFSVPIECGAIAGVLAVGRRSSRVRVFRYDFQGHTIDILRGIRRALMTSCRLMVGTKERCLSLRGTRSDVDIFLYS